MRRKKLFKALAVLALLAFIFDTSSAQAIAPFPSSAPASSTQPSALESSVRISMEFEDAPLSSVIKALSEQSGINFVAGEGVKDQKVTLYLDKVTLKEALDTILKATGLTYQQVGANIFVILQESKLSQLTVTKVYPLNYANVEEKKEKQGDEEITIPGFETIVRKLLSPYGSYIADPRTNSVIITDVPERHEQIAGIIAQLDTKAPQVLIETEILETGSALLKDLGFRWGTGTNGTIFTIKGGSMSTLWPYVGNPFGSVSKAPDMLRRGLAHMPPTVLAPGEAISSAYYVPGFFETGLASFTSLQFVLSALERDTRTKVLGRPKILTLNNKTAEIQIITKTAIASTTSISAGAGGVSTGASNQAERVETGTKLKVTPQINKDDYITLMVEPSVTTVADSSHFPPALVGAVFVGFVDPTTRTAKTTVMVKDGDTVVIGGLITTEDSDVLQKVPVVGDFPILGNMFRAKHREKTDKEIVVFLTPHILREELAVTVGAGSAPALSWGPSSAGAGAMQTALPAQTMPRGTQKAAVAPKKVVLEREQEASSRDEVIEQTIKGLK